MTSKAIIALANLTWPDVAFLGVLVIGFVGLVAVVAWSVKQ